ncbi:hypothetical protein HAX54_010874, partial [Datura stramonium]|nr:hypothetical protein [Datura stramonium]
LTDEIGDPPVTRRSPMGMPVLRSKPHPYVFCSSSSAVRASGPAARESRTVPFFMDCPQPREVPGHWCYKLCGVAVACAYFQERGACILALYTIRHGSSRRTMARAQQPSPRVMGHAMRHWRRSSGMGDATRVSNGQKWISYFN